MFSYFPPPLENLPLVFDDFVIVIFENFVGLAVLVSGVLVLLLNVVIYFSNILVLQFFSCLALTFIYLFVCFLSCIYF